VLGEKPWDRLEPLVSRLSSLKRIVSAEALTLRNSHFVLDMAPSTPYSSRNFYSYTILLMDKEKKANQINLRNF